MGTSYSKAFDDALSELGELLRRRRGIDGEISRLRNVILALYEKAGATKTQKETLMNFFGEIDVSEPRLTEAVKDALYNTPRKLPAIQVKELMEVRRFDFGDFANPLASVHSTLRRLARQGEIGVGLDKGSAVYWWDGPRWGARNSLANMLADREMSRMVDEKIRARVDQNLTRLGINVHR